jgi:hypothetical protein
VGIERNVQGGYVPTLSSDVVYSRTDYVKLITAQSKFPGCVRGEQSPTPSCPTDPSCFAPNFWCGLAVSGFNTAMDATYGLLIFAGILSFAAWVFAQSVSGGNVTILSNPHVFKITGGLMALSCFFTFVAIVQFDAAKIKTVFCSVFDPPESGSSASNGYCSYSDGFRVGIFGIVFSAITTALQFFWLPHTVGNLSYGFKSDAAAPEASAAAPALFSSSSASSGYEGIGSS